MPPWAWEVWEKARAHRGGQYPAQTGEGGSNGKGDWRGVFHIPEGDFMRGRGPVLPSLAEPSVEWKAPKHLLRIELKSIVFG